MDPLVERDMEATLLTDWLELMVAEGVVLFRRDDRASESERAGKVREELEADEVSAIDREEESLAFL